MVLSRWLALGVACIHSAMAEDVVLVTFDGAEGSTHHWLQMNDPVMGGESTGTFTVDPDRAVGIMDGKVVDVPFLKAPGFIKALPRDTPAQQIYPDISSCQAIA